MAVVTVLGPWAVSRPPYGSFAGKVEAGAHAPGNVTVLGPLGVSRPPYGSFAGKGVAVAVAAAEGTMYRGLFGGPGKMGGQ